MPITSYVTGSADPQPGTEAEWSANADEVFVTNDILDNVKVLAPASGVADNHQCTVSGRTDLGAIVTGLSGEDVTIPYPTSRAFVYTTAGGWSPVA